MGEKQPGRIPIVDAKRIAEAHRVPMVVIFAIYGDEERFTVTTYGRTKALCRLAASYGEKIAKGIELGEIVAHREEPKHLPDEPTVFDCAPSSAPGSGT